MALLQFSTIVTRVKDITKLSNKDSLIKDSIQMGLNRLTSEPLPYLTEEGVIQTVAPYETGTVSVTNGSATVTGSGTTFTLAMVGRKIRVAGENTYYKIKSFSSATSITLENNFIGSTQSGSSFSIFKDEYRLAPDLDNYKAFKNLNNNSSIIDVDPLSFDIVQPSPSATGTPLFSILQGNKLDTETTGTVSGSVNTTTLTGDSTTWTSVEGLGRGSRITIGTVVFTVKSIDSDTQITTYEAIPATISASTSYIILLDNYIIQFYNIPDSQEVIRYKYQRIPFPLVDDEDIPDLPSKYHHILVTAGSIWAWATKDKKESEMQRQIFESQKIDMWSKIGYISKSRIYPRRNQAGDLADSSLFPIGPRLPSNIGRFSPLPRFR